ncbi:TPA: hypothetical protein N6T07_004035 [Escherichia coli]|nr:hypothetical protein [Escherichia coli]
MPPTIRWSGIRGGRDVNLVAESAGAGDSYTSKKKKEINETVRQQGTEIASGGDTTVNAGRDQSERWWQLRG